MENFKEIWDSFSVQDKCTIYTLIGRSFTSGKRQAIPKSVYDRLTKDQRKAARYILDLAQKCFGNIDYGMGDKK